MMAWSYFFGKASLYSLSQYSGELLCRLLLRCCVYPLRSTVIKITIISSLPTLKPGKCYLGPKHEHSQKPKSYQHRRARLLYCSTSQKHLKCRDARLPHLTLSFLWSIALKLEIRVTYITPNKFAYVSRDCSILARNAADAFLHNCLFTCLIKKARLLLPLLAGIYTP